MSRFAHSQLPQLRQLVRIRVAFSKLQLRFPTGSPEQWNTRAENYRYDRGDVLGYERLRCERGGKLRADATLGQRGKIRFAANLQQHPAADASAAQLR